MTVLRSHDGAVYALATDGTWLASTGEDGDVVLFELSTGEEQVVLRSPPDHWDHAHRLQWAGGVLHWASLAGHAGEVTPHAAVMDLPMEDARWASAVEETLCDLAVGADGTMVVAGGDGDGRIVLERPNGDRFEGKTYKWPYTVALSPSGASLVVGTWAGRVHVASSADLAALDQSELEVGSLLPCFDATWLSESTVVVVGSGRGGAASVWAATVAGQLLWSAAPGADALCVARFGAGVAVGFSTGEVVVFAADGAELQRFAPLENAPGAQAPFPSNAEYFEVPPRAVCSLAAHKDSLFVGLAGGVVRQLR